jgi:hypothetical protein
MNLPNEDKEETVPQSDKILEKFAFGEQFQEQQKQKLGLRVGLCVLGFGFHILAYYLGVHLQARPVFYLIPFIIGSGVLFMYYLLQSKTSRCPSCEQNIKTCLTVFCHVCGEKLKNRRCERCDVDQSWMVAVRPTHEFSGNHEYITYCPQCGVCLNSNFSRDTGGSS